MSAHCSVVCSASPIIGASRDRRQRKLRRRAPAQRARGGAETLSASLRARAPRSKVNMHACMPRNGTYWNDASLRAPNLRYATKHTPEWCHCCSPRRHPRSLITLPDAKDKAPRKRLTHTHIHTPDQRLARSPVKTDITHTLSRHASLPASDKPPSLLPRTIFSSQFTQFIRRQSLLQNPVCSTRRLVLHMSLCEKVNHHDERQLPQPSCRCVSYSIKALMDKPINR
jgi:hypothetical protein